jgi:CBS domain-containing protein
MGVMVGEIMSEKIQTIASSSSAQAAAKRMKDKEVSSLLVVDNNRAIGIVTEGDLIRKICVNDENSSDITVNQIMSSPLLTIKANTSLAEAADLMINRKVRHLLVVEDNEQIEPLGIVTQTDFAHYLDQNLDLDDVNTRIIESLKREE